jgi:Zn-dependent protease
VFRKTYRLPFKLLGIPLELDVTFLIVLPLFAWIIARNIPAYVELFNLDLTPESLESFQQGSLPLILGLTAAIGLFASVVIHELGHSVVGRAYGMEITSITLWILGGMARFKEISRRPGAEAVMAIAGPATSYALAGVFWLTLRVAPGNAESIVFLLSYLMWMNVILATFNLIPALPLDGGRVLRSLLALRMDHAQATQVAAGVSRFFAFGLGLLGLVTFNLLLVLIAFFVLMTGSSESQLATVRAALEDIPVGDLMTSEVRTVSRDLTVPGLLDKMLTEKHLAYPVLGTEGEILGVVTVRELEHKGKVHQGEPPATVGDVMLTEFGTIRPDESAYNAFVRITQNGTGRLLVERDGRLVGILSKTDLIHAVQVRLVGKALRGDRALTSLPS